MQRTAHFVGLLAVAGALCACDGSAPAALPPQTASRPLESLAAAEPEPVAEAEAVEGSGAIQTSDGSEHRYFFHIPAGPAPAAGRPVLLWLHGDGGEAEGFGAGFYPYSDPDGAVVVTPQGSASNPAWTHAASDLPGQAQDAQFLSLLIEQLLQGGVAGAAIDAQRVYLGGESRGAYLPYYLLMRASTRDRLAAVAANAGGLYCQSGDGECVADAWGPAHEAHAAILHLHGTNDLQVPPPTATFHTPVDWDDDPRVFSPIKFWAYQNGCFGRDNSTSKDSGVLIESSMVGGHSAALYDLSAWGEQCRKYELLLVSNGGHVIAQQHARIWQFLSRYDLGGLRVAQPAPEPVEPPAPNEPGVPAPPAPVLGNGRLLWDSCIPVCASSVSDPDENGVSDGWGYENGVSCVVAEGAVASQGPPCELPPAAPLVEPNPGPQARPEGNSSQGFFVSGGRLYDRLGHDFVMRGVNHPLAWYPEQSLAWIDEIALTGANTVRLVWRTDSAAPLLHDAIARTIEQKMIPIVELHDVTGDDQVDQPRQMAEYYVNQVRDTLLEFEGELLVNIANEWSGPDELYTEAYSRAITLLRDAGIQHTLVIDANDWGQNAATLIAQGPGLLEADPQHNLLFSLHMYHDHFATPESVLGALQGAANAHLPFIIGEFGSTPLLENDESGVIPVQALLEEAQRLRLGVLAWLWTGFSDGQAAQGKDDKGSMDLSAHGSAAQLTAWGHEVVDGPFGLQNTSQRASVFAADRE